MSHQPPNESATEMPAWQRRFRAPVVLWTQSAALTPERGLAVANPTGVHQLYAWEVATGNLRQLTNRPEGMLFGLISPDGRYVYYLDDTLGNEIGHYVRVPFDGNTESAPEDVTPSLLLYASADVALSRSSNLLAFVAPDAEGFHVYALDLAPDGEPSAPRKLHTSRKLLSGLAVSYDGTCVAFGSTERHGNLNLTVIALDAHSGDQIGELSDGSEGRIEPISFAPLAGDSRLLGSTNASGVQRPLLWNPRTDERTDLLLADLEGEVAPLDWSPDGARLLLCEFARARQQLLVYEVASDTLRSLPHPSGTYGFMAFGGMYFSSNDSICTPWQDATHPQQVLALDATTGEPLRTLLTAGEVPPSRPWRSITFPSSDGREIQGWLAVPEGAGPFATILETHGGPTSVQTEQFRPGAQAWLDAGYAYCTINYRGSITFGRDFERQIWGDLGHWELEDMVAARAWLVAQGIAQPEQVLLTGGSYGGYLTLLGLGKRPELWAGGMALIAIADWAIQYEDSAETLKGYQVALFGGTPQDRPELYAAASPITYVEQVRAPVLIIQGRNDTRTPARPIQLYEQRMRALGKPIEVVWFDAGHLGASAQTEQFIGFQERMLAFTRQVVGTRSASDSPR
jgi:dipeptidyl aminopeptidase/acylaminoacyl peptidase